MLEEAEIKSLKYSFAPPLSTITGDFAFWGLDNSSNAYGNTEEVSFPHSVIYLMIPITIISVGVYQRPLRGRRAVSHAGIFRPRTARQRA